jgi:hypothetical protein
MVIADALLFLGKISCKVTFSGRFSKLAPYFVVIIEKTRGFSG